VIDSGDWMINFYDMTGEPENWKFIATIKNSKYDLIDFLKEHGDDNLFISFNGKNYDKWILDAIQLDLDIVDFSHYIIKGGTP
jgi:hypothetical protein